MPTRPFVVILVVVLARLREMFAANLGKLSPIISEKVVLSLQRSLFFHGHHFILFFPLRMIGTRELFAINILGNQYISMLSLKLQIFGYINNSHSLLHLFFFATIALCVESPEKDETTIEPKFRYQHYKYKFCSLGFQVFIQSVCLLCLSLGLYVISSAQANQMHSVYIGFALTGLGPVAIYPGREFQRAFFRQVRSLKNTNNPKANYQAYIARDSTYDGVVYNNFIIAGQILTFLLYQTSFESVGYPNLIRAIGVGGGGLSALLVLLTLFSCRRCLCMKSCLEEEDSCNGYCCSKQCLSICDTDSSNLLVVVTKPNFFPSAPMMKVAPRIRFRTHTRNINYEMSFRILCRHDRLLTMVVEDVLQQIGMTCLKRFDRIPDHLNL